MSQEPSFSSELFAFLRELAANNDREWFEANRDRYEAAVREPALAFIEDAGHRLPEISRHFVADARRTGGSLFRIHRDTRFSKDKSPYKTHVGIRFNHVSSRDVHAPVHYLHLEPGRVFAGCGIWHPEATTLRRIRDAIAAHPDEWRAGTTDDAFAECFELGGEVLKRAPQGFPADHPLVEDLKRKDFVALAPVSEEAVVSPGFLDEWVSLARRPQRFMRFVCDAAGVPY